jgi:hypothetical protein
MLNDPDVDRQLTRIGAILSDILPAVTAYLISSDSAGAILRVQCGCTPLSEDEVSFLHGGRSRMFIEQIRSTSKPILTAGVDRMSSLDPFLSGCLSLLAVPIMSADGQVAGIIDLESVEESAFHPAWEGVVTYLADLVALAADIRKRPVRGRTLSLPQSMNCCTEFPCPSK